MTTYPDFNATALLLQLTEDVKSVNSSVNYATWFRTDMNKSLQIPLNIIDDGTRSVEEIAYASWLQSNLDYGWYTLRVMSAPCIYVSFFSFE